MFSCVENHVKDNSNCKDIDAPRVALFGNQLLGSHKYERAHLLLGRNDAELFVLGAEPEVCDFDSRVVVYVTDENVI